MIIMCIAMLFTVAAATTSCKSGAELSANVIPLTVSVGKIPDAIDYFTDISASDATAEYVKQPQITDYGTYTVYLKLSGNGQTKTFTSELTVINDITPPTINGVSDIYISRGDSVAYRKGITVTDNCAGECTLEVDSSAVDTFNVGKYPVYYTATDAAGNKTTATAYVYVTYNSETVTKEQLWELVDPIIASNVTDSMTKEQKIRRIYKYIQDNMVYFDESDKGDWVKEAYESLSHGYGDCFSYFAVTKAFLVRLGIEYRDIQRTAGIVDETHYWCMVNIGENGEDRWYHLDTCELRDDGYNHSGCLLTDAQIEAYNKVRVNSDGVSGYFYAYDKSAYPVSAVQVITPTPNLDY